MIGNVNGGGGGNSLPLFTKSLEAKRPIVTLAQLPDPAALCGLAERALTVSLGLTAFYISATIAASLYVQMVAWLTLNITSLALPEALSNKSGKQMNGSE